jgi:L-Ala-D/L-Glu epimerase
LQTLLPPGGARNALDCALWDLEARRSGRAVWQLAGLSAPRPLLTTYTIGAESPASMAASAAGYRHARAIKLKLLGEVMDAARVREVRAARPDVWLGVDANQGFSRAHFDSLLPTLVEARVALIEQPFRVGTEPALSDLQSPIPVAADESVQGLADMRRAQGRFNAVNIKLDKCGGLTEGLAMAREASAMGFGLMVGNMVGTSLAMAPAFLVGQMCEVVDLDGPVLLLNDRVQRARYRDGCIDCDEAIWGGPR